MSQMLLQFGGHSTVGLCLPKDMCGPAEDARCEMGCTTHQGQAQCTCNLCATLAVSVCVYVWGVAARQLAAVQMPLLCGLCA